MQKINRKSIVMLFVMFLFFANIGMSFAYWASSVLSATDDSSGQVTIGEWLPPGFTGIKNTAGGGFITLDQVGVGGNLLSDSYILMEDIDWQNNAFTPIGGASGTFSGTFLGSGFKISNVSITAVQTNVGLFARNSGTISGVSLINVNVNVTSAADMNAGGLVGENIGNIVKSYSTGTLNITVSKTANTNGLTSNAYGGGLAGQNSGNIHNSHSSVTVGVTSIADVGSGGGRTGFANGYAGGLIGRDTSASGVINTYAEGSVTVSSSGLAGGNGNGTALAVGGGLVGQANNNGINNSFGAGNVTATATQTRQGTATINVGPVSGLGTVIISFARIGQSINSVTDGGSRNGATLASQTDLRLESWVVTNLEWDENDWVFDTTHYPRIAGNSY